MNRLSAAILVAAAVVSGCDKQPTTQVQNPPQPTDATSGHATNAARADSERQAIPQVSDLFKSQVTKLVEEGTKLDQLLAQGIGVAEVKSQVVATKAPFELARLTWPVGLATNALSNCGTAIRAWEFAIDLSERDQKLQARISEVLGKRWSTTDAAFAIAWAESARAPHDLPESRKRDQNGYEELVSFAGESNLVYSTHPHNYSLEDYRGIRFLPLKENAEALFGIASKRFKSAREELLKFLK